MEELSEKLLYDLRRQVESAGLNMDPRAINALTTVINNGLDKYLERSRSLDDTFERSDMSPRQQALMEDNAKIFAAALITQSRGAGADTVELDTVLKSIRSVCPLWPFC